MPGTESTGMYRDSNLQGEGSRLTSPPEITQRGHTAFFPEGCIVHTVPSRTVCPSPSPPYTSRCSSTRSTLTALSPLVIKVYSWDSPRRCQTPGLLLLSRAQLHTKQCKSRTLTLLCSVNKILLSLWSFMNSGRICHLDFVSSPSNTQAGGTIL